MVSGSPTTDAAVAEAGVDLFLAKPLNTAELLTSVSKLIHA
jgi:DNA-binding response OmpR family regulator